MSRGRVSKKALIPGPDRVRKIVALYQDSERKGGWTGGKSVIGAKQLQDVIDTLGADTPAWFQQILDGNYGHHGFLDYGQAKQILTLIEALALKAQPGHGAGGSQADQEGGKGVAAAPPPYAPAGEARAEIQGWLEDRLALHQNQLLVRFLRWLAEKNCHVCGWDVIGDEFLRVTNGTQASFEKLVADYQGIDLAQVAAERREVVKWANSRVIGDGLGEGPHD